MYHSSQRDLHDSVTRQLRTPAARLASSDTASQTDALPGLLPDASANRSRQRHLIEQFRAQRASAQASNPRPGWGDLDVMHEPPVLSRASRLLPNGRMSDDGHGERRARFHAQRRALFPGSRRRDVDIRTLGDYVVSSPYLLTVYRGSDRSAPCRETRILILPMRDCFDLRALLEKHVPEAFLAVSSIHCPAACIVNGHLQVQNNDAPSVSMM